MKYKALEEKPFDILKNIANALIKVAEKEGLYGFRFGGEEFGVILPGVDIEGGKIAAERMREENKKALGDVKNSGTITATAIDIANGEIGNIYITFNL